MTSISSKKTNAVAFGNYGIVLDRDQLCYYYEGKLTRVVEVGPAFTSVDLFKLATKISEKNSFGVVQFVHKSEIIK